MLDETINFILLLIKYLWCGRINTLSEYAIFLLIYILIILFKNYTRASFLNFNFVFNFFFSLIGSYLIFSGKSLKV